MPRSRLVAGLLAGAACPLLALAAGAATAATLRDDHTVHETVVLAATTYVTGLALLGAAPLVGTGYPAPRFLIGAAIRSTAAR
ncbi:hypothetical protein C7C46_09590 [Streptomyces tateyamensis]|uniref:Uncharacterized protein n=1 Tax=Streptomyces tateyamensis TaxID=565073 RepID=A0A2V4NFL2_9ACTN|nr:hypothetical protein C7C46_09590 [Streptomyces tateyamensis]